jgi:tetratricopeptide (TPR) repeat protein
MSEQKSRIDELRAQALAKIQSEDFEEALVLYDQALSLAPDDELRELITINKADALIAIGRSGPEVQALPRILMARRNPHHTFIAAYALMYKHRLANETKRAIFYGQIALDAARDADEAFWKVAALNDLGIAYEIDSQFEKAIPSFEQALTISTQVDDPARHTFLAATIYQNLGYNLMLVGETRQGIRMIESILADITVRSTRCDAHIDLCYGYLDLDEFVTALEHGRKGLEFACEPRQTRNAHYLLGEAAYKLGDVETAETHFEELARFYPEFPQLKNVLFALDLRSMINLRL